LAVENGIGLVGRRASEERFVEDLRVTCLQAEKEREQGTAGGGWFEEESL